MSKELNEEEQKKLEEMNIIYKKDVKRQVKDQLISEFDKVYDNKDISAENKDWALGMALSVLKKVQQMK
jgi:predicted fused transcriptional regulator/phosphomethylpyrimidine kinase